MTHNAAMQYMADIVVKLRDGAIRKVIQNTEKTAAKDLEW